MRTLITSIFFILMVLPAAIAQNNKQFLLDYLTSTQARLQKSVAGLSEVQLNYKETPESWSISQCLEHIIKTEQMLFRMVKKNLALPANINEKGAPTNTDEQILKMITDRSKKHKAMESLIPVGKYTAPETALKDLKEFRMAILDLINNTPEALLRDHVTESPLGIVDQYQNFLFLAGHTERHTLQVEEVKANVGFPKQ